MRKVPIVNCNDHCKATNYMVTNLRFLVIVRISALFKYKNLEKKFKAAVL